MRLLAVLHCPASFNPSDQQAYIHHRLAPDVRLPSPIEASTAVMAIGTIPSTLGGVKGVVGVPPANCFEQLVLALKEALGPSSGLTSDDVNVDFLTRLMADYDSRPAEWSRYAFGDNSRGYTRNLVDEGNGKSNLVSRPPRADTTWPGLTNGPCPQLVLVWSPGKGSPIHDHGNAHCLMKILRGNLTETRYAFPDEGEPEGPITVLSEQTYKENAVAYMADELMIVPID